MGTVRAAAGRAGSPAWVAEPLWRFWIRPPDDDLAGAITLEPFIGTGGAGDVAAQAFELLALTGAAAHGRVQAEAVRIGAQCRHAGFAST